MNAQATSIKTSPTVNQALSQALTDTYALLTLTQSAHWHVTGQNFFGLHVALEEQYDHLFAVIDDIAERARALGETTILSVHDVAKNTNLKESLGTDSGMDQIKALISAHQTVLEAFKHLSSVSEEAGDNVSAGMAQDQIAWHDKTLWMLNSFTH